MSSTVSAPTLSPSAPVTPLPGQDGPIGTGPRSGADAPTAAAPPAPAMPPGK